MSTDIQRDEPFYPIGMAAKLIGITADRLRTYEEEGLIYPHKLKKVSEKQKGAKRLYSQDDIDWIKHLREVVKTGISIPSLRIILNLLPYWQESDCEEVKNIKNDKSWKLIKKLISHPVYEKTFKISESR